MASGNQSTTKGSPFTPLYKLEERMVEVFEGKERTVTGLIIFLRGLPGSGKTKLARQLKDTFSADTVVFSVGKHISNRRPKTNLLLDSDELEIATAACKQAFWSTLKAKPRFIIIDNDNLAYSDMAPYASRAIDTDNNYEVHFVQPDGMSQCSLTTLARRNRRGLNQEKLREMRSKFETFLTAEEFVADLRSRKRLPPTTLKLKIDPEPTLLNPTSSGPQLSPLKEGSQEAPSVADLTEKLMELHTSPTEGKTAPLSPGAVSYEEKLEQLKAIYPEHKLSRLKEALELANGDLVYASAIVAESRYDRYVISNEEESCSESLSSTGLEKGLMAMLDSDDDSLNVSDTSDVSVPCIHLQPKFIKSLLEKYSAELPNVSIDFDGIPSHKFDDWKPDEKLSKQILLSFLEHIGCDNQDKESTSETRYKDGECSRPVGLADDLPSSTVEEDRALQGAVLESIKPFQEKFQDPNIQKDLKELEQAYPSIDRELIKLAMVRSEFDMYEVKLCLEGNLVDPQSFQEASDLDLAHKYIEYEESQAERKQKGKRSYAALVSQRALIDEFPSFDKSTLEELLKKYGSAEEVRSYLGSLGHVPQSVSIGSARELPKEETSGRQMLFPYTPEQAICLLDSEEKKLNELYDLKSKRRESVRMSPRGAKAFYTQELKTVTSDIRRQAALVGGLLVSVNSQKKFDELPKESQRADDPAWRVRTWFSNLDLHKMTGECSEEAIRQRISICKKGKVLPYTPLPTFSIVPSIVAPDGSFELPSQYRPGKLTVITGCGKSIIRKRVEGYLNQAGLRYTSLNPGCLEVDFN
ncbi:hypothetical protein Aperf_G00000070899 [Anoplocephala perfoliata]